MQPLRANGVLQFSNVAKTDVTGALGATQGNPALSAVAEIAGPFLHLVRGGGAEPNTAEREGVLRAAALFGADALAFALSFGIAAIVAHLRHAELRDLGALPAWLSLGFACGALHLASHGHYTRRLPVLAQLQGAAAAAIAGLMCTSLAAYLMHLSGARVAVLLGWALFAPLLLGTRELVRLTLRLLGRWEIPVLLVAPDADAQAARQVLQGARHLGYRITGQVSPDELPANAAARGLSVLLRAHGARMVLLAHGADPWSATGWAGEAGGSWRGLLEALVRHRVPVAVLQSTHGLPAIGCEHHWFVGHDTTLLTFATTRARPFSRAVKAAFDLTAAGAALVVLAPLFLVIAALVKLDGGPAFFGHTRIGHGGRVFRCLKFRTMVVNAEEVLHELLARDPQAAAEWNRDQKLRNDPRITWIGRVLRKTSLDELPQLLNVVRREMSLVGPRPIVSKEVRRYADDISYYYEIRPGITGLWQISGRNDTGYERRVELDRWYVKNWTIGRDIAILFRTLPAVMSGRGAS